MIPPGATRLSILLILYIFIYNTALWFEGVYRVGYSRGGDGGMVLMVEG